MPASNIQVVPSSPLAKAYSMSVQQDVYDTIRLTTTKPTGDGIFAMGEGGDHAVTRLTLWPYCEGPPLSSFGMRLYGWRSIGPEGPHQDRPKVWLWMILAEFLCVAGDIPGPRFSNNPGPSGFNLPIGPTENMCDYLMLTRGVLGLSGFINSGTPGSGVTAWAGVEIYGSQLIYFDFAQSPGSNVAANCFWARS